jgi:aryl-alcohol dehydrogenase-like predicted oxidoreductase
MNLRQLGNSDLHITPIGIGAWAMGGGQWEWSWVPKTIPIPCMQFMKASKAD